MSSRAALQYILGSDLSMSSVTNNLQFNFIFESGFVIKVGRLPPHP